MFASYKPSDATTLAESAYKIDYSRPGVVIIFNNKVFTDSKYRVRDGSEQDVSSLCTLFRDLNYVVRPPYTDKTEADMRKAIDEYANDDYTSYGCLSLQVLDHPILSITVA